MMCLFISPTANYTNSVITLQYFMLTSVSRIIIIFVSEFEKKGSLRTEAKFAIIATGLKPGMSKFRAPPTSGLGVTVASVTQLKIGHCMSHFGGAPSFQLRT